MAKNDLKPKALQQNRARINYNGNENIRRKWVGHMLRKGNGSQERGALDWNLQRTSSGRPR
jgi:hypothetical protein